METKVLEKTKNVLGQVIGSIITYNGIECRVLDSHHYMYEELYQTTCQKYGNNVQRIVDVEFIENENENGRQLKFKGLVDYLKWRKIDPHYEYTDFIKKVKDSYLDEIFSPFIPQSILEWLWLNEPAYNGSEMISKFDNAEERMLLFRLVGPGAIMNAFEAKAIVQDRLKKSFPMFLPKEGVTIDTKTDNVEDLFDEVIYEKDETLTLYRIDKSQLGSGIGNGATDIYVVHVVCPSTGRDYHLFVDINQLEKREGEGAAIAAVAWTLHLSVDEYINGLRIES